MSPGSVANIFFHGKRHPGELGGADVTRFLRALAVERHVPASTQNQALSALLFLYRDVLDVELPWLSDIMRAKRPERLPVVLSRDEVRALIQRLDGAPRLRACLLYGAGLVMECCRLRVQDLDFGSNQIVVRGGNGDKDRTTMLPTMAKADLAGHLAAVRAQHQRDVVTGAGWVASAAPRTGCSTRYAKVYGRRHRQTGSAPPISPHGATSLRWNVRWREGEVRNPNATESRDMLRGSAASSELRSRIRRSVYF